MRRSAGFTLIEVVVALALAGLVVLLAERLYGGLLDGAVRAEEARERLDRWANSRRLLTRLVGSVEVGPEAAAAFRGEPQRASFTAWLADAHGWPERRAVTIAAEQTALVVGGFGGGPLALADSVTGVEFDYLLSQGAGTRWVRSFISEVSAPLALRVRIARPAGTDTLVVIMGPRG